MNIAYKPAGVPLGHLTKQISQNTQTKVSFVGRLDPMASGIILYLYGDECKNKNNYMNLDKTYKFNLIIGVSTDTNDCLGLINDYKPTNTINFSILHNVISQFNNSTYEQKYPIYSAYNICKNGIKKPLWYFAKYDSLSQNEIPSHPVNIYILEQQTSPIITIKSNNYFMEQISLLPDGLNLRKEEIIKQYQEMDNVKCVGIPMVAKVSTGTYIRQLCADIGDKIGIPCMADKIERIGYHVKGLK